MLLRSLQTLQGDKFMSRLTLRLPQTLHQDLSGLAEAEGVSLNQYIVYALSRQAAIAYTVHPVPAESIKQQEASFAALLQSLGQTSFSEIEQVLSEREEAEPEVGLTPEVIAKLQKKIATRRTAN